MSGNDTKRNITRLLRNSHISFVLLIVFFIAKSALASDSVRTFASDSIKIREPDTTGIHRTDSAKSHLLNNFKPDTARYLTSDTVKIHKTDSGTAKINLQLNKRHKNTIGEDLLYDGGIFVKDWGRFLTVPLRMKGTDWLIGAGVIGGTFLSALADRRIHNSLSVSEAGITKRNFFDIAAYYGYIYYQAAFAGGLYLTGLFTRSDDVRETARMILQSLAYSGTITIGLRYAFDRERPYVTDEPYKFDWFKVKSLDTQSFPSGHTAVAFAVSTILAERIGTWWSRVIFYGAAGLTGYSKIRTNQHWFSDVVFGALMGFGSSWFILHEDNARKDKSKKVEKKSAGGFSFYPSFNGFGIIYRL